MDVKKSILVEGSGGLLSICIAGANVHDISLLESKLEAVVVKRPAITEETPQHLCLNKAYNNNTGYAICEKLGYVPHVHRIGKEKKDEAGQKKHLARRWVVERTFAWLS